MIRAGLTLRYSFPVEEMSESPAASTSLSLERDHAVCYHVIGYAIMEV